MARRATRSGDAAELHTGRACLTTTAPPNPDVPEERPRIALSVVIPCLNESRSLAGVIRWAEEGIRQSGLNGEVIVADNGSTDGSVGIARDAGARVIRVPGRGYGRAILGGIAAAAGDLVVIGDADGSYDFREIPRFVAALRAGDDLVIGCRLARGGGAIGPGAMPWLNRVVGNPAFSWVARKIFGLSCHDIHSGMRAASRRLLSSLPLRSAGMEFASEMIIRAHQARARIGEIPITLLPDRRCGRRSHLRPVRDGLRHIVLWFSLLKAPPPPRTGCGAV